MSSKGKDGNEAAMCALEVHPSNGLRRWFAVPVLAPYCASASTVLEELLMLYSKQKGRQAASSLHEVHPPNQPKVTLTLRALRAFISFHQHTAAAMYNSREYNNARDAWNRAEPDEPKTYTNGAFEGEGAGCGGRSSPSSQQRAGRGFRGRGPPGGRNLPSASRRCVGSAAWPGSGTAPYQLARGTHAAPACCWRPQLLRACMQAHNLPPTHLLPPQAALRS